MCAERSAPHSGILTPRPPETIVGCETPGRAADKAAPARGPMPILPIVALLYLQSSTVVTAPSRQLMVTVTDDKGQPIEGLTPEEIAVTENGVAREVTRPELDRPPLTGAMIVDTSEPMGSIYRLNIVEPVVQ